ncbi:mitogen-activated protein kinase kinase kinase 5-like [Andrographis paniculata]|uniref:mitogen-activated protein kinase kinase kinase 5-like n=1 Tax=Andrographis paniculata TaxID=175694 RepID=UPI0021E98D65|nr:mitogen-activated protein kinase kinase kinase 5-like [Andrographis paniculata]XP_051124024.1 mitogen-activated protein kinase kinase kinase 5-like [Andrographis paniculata]
MPSLWSSFSSSSGGGGRRPLKGKSKSSNDILRNEGRNEQRRKLTRQRKLRYVTDDELGLTSTGIIHEGLQSLPVSPDCGAAPGSVPRTPNRATSLSCHWSKSVVPQPLPLPEVSCQAKHNDGSHGQRLGVLVSPAASAEKRDPSYHRFWKTTDDIVSKTNKSPAYRRRGFKQDLNVDISENEFHLRFPAKSAPSSGCSSPVQSSQRYSTVDLFHPSFPASSSIGLLTSDRVSKSHQTSPKLTPEHSPLHSPRQQSPTKYGNSRSNKCFIMHSHNKSLPESSALKPDANNLNVHPLPRPPAVSWPSPTIRHSLDKSNLSSVKGQWQKGRLIGRGTYGSVYIATHRETGATCAVKEVEVVPDDPKCAESVKQLEQEMKFLGELKHQNIVQYYGCEKIEDRFCIYLEYVYPGSISKYVQEHCGAMTECIVRNFTRHILSGLAYLHSKMTVHRDIKGANLLVDASGVVKLADFGLAKHLVGHNIELSLKGTPHWMAPELLQAALRKDANPELAYGVDIWSVGCTIIEMLTGKPPWSEYSGPQAMFNVLKKSPTIPETLSAEGKDFLHWCFQRRPEDRPSALKLLEHPFMRSSKDQNCGGLFQQFSGIKLHDLENSSRWTRHKKDVMPHSSATRTHQGKPPQPNSETSRQSGPDSSDAGGSTSHNSPRCIHDVLPSGSSPELNRSSNSSSPSSAQNNLLLRAVNNNACSISCKGNLNPLMPRMTERKKENCSVQQEIN